MNSPNGKYVKTRSLCTWGLLIMPTMAVSDLQNRFRHSTPPPLTALAVNNSPPPLRCEFGLWGWYFFVTAAGVVRMAVDLCGPPPSIATPIILSSQLRRWPSIYPHTVKIEMLWKIIFRMGVASAESVRRFGSNSSRCGDDGGTSSSPSASHSQ